MPIYEYQCRFHDEQKHIAIHSIEEHDTYVPPACPVCHETLSRDYTSISIAPVRHAHFNQAVGKVISDDKQFAQELRRKEDEMSERLGFDQHYGIADPSDTKHLGVTSE